MTEKEKEIVNKLGHNLYTVEFLERWIYRNDYVEINAPAALQAMGAKGYYQAVQQMAKLEVRMTSGVTECCGYDFGMDAYGKIKPKYCPMCGKKIM